MEQPGKRGLAAVVAYSAAQETTNALGNAVLGSLLAALAGGVVLIGIYLAAARALRVREVDVVARRVRSRVGALVPR
jgi:putative peptidoglycan lipid II flippase